MTTSSEFFLFIRGLLFVQMLVADCVAGRVPEQCLAPAVDGSISSLMVLNLCSSQARVKVAMSLQAVSG